MATRSGMGRHLQGITGGRAILRQTLVVMALLTTAGRAWAQSQAEPPPFSPPADAPPPVDPPREAAPPTPPTHDAKPPPEAPAPALPELPPPSAPRPTAAARAAAPTVSTAMSAPPSAPATGRAPASDPQADRVLLLPTAYTHPKGTLYVSNYELVIFQVGYAITDSTQISLTTLPLANEELTVLDLSLKTALVRGDLVRAAAIGSVSGIVGAEVGVIFLGRVGGVAQLCMARHCDSSISLSSNVALAGPVMLMVNGVGGIVRASRRVSFVGELSTMVPLGTVGGELNGGLLGGGVRLHYDHWAFDFSLLHVLESDSDSPTIPFVTATYRSN
jgi:hypothetical protein